MNHPVLAPAMVQPQVQVPQGFVVIGVPPPAFSARQVRMHKKCNRLKTEFVIRQLIDRNPKFRAVLTGSKAARINWMLRAFDTGKLGCRHRNFIAGRCVHQQPFLLCA